ncbi:MAG: flavin reductase family protein [Alphaproteobacteria bacterium]|nr:flavin reductase family protein [Rhodospirillaceae bacterium]MBT6203340.1 flavin reductase family protein [Rhodospirillaceae bacterium]MBT6512574.1 flavin reductase family protein [Rhodospirillaceae bacterium]MBT7649142.1 flavin reductase family protein [Rhodospirillaceae bacterium]MDG2481804.1 flavin reductase family protein [Alphaproteobacteria bacterium]
MALQTQNPVPVLPEFKDAMAEFPSGVTVATCRNARGEAYGATLSSVTSLSLDPPMVLACFARNSTTLQALYPGVSFRVHVLAEGQEDVAMAFAGRSSDKFANVDWHKDEAGPPRLKGCTLVLTCRVAHVIPGGDHMIVTGLVDDTQMAHDCRPLVYHRRRMGALPEL